MKPFIYNSASLVKPTHRLLHDLQIARANGSHPRQLARILAFDLLVLDDFGLQSISPQAAQDLYEIITERYEHGSLIITSNRAFDYLIQDISKLPMICLPAQPLIV